MGSARGAFKVHWPAILVAVLLGLLGLAAWRLPEDSDWRDLAVVLWGLVPVTVAVAQYASTRSDRYRLFATRLRYFVLNPEATWSFVAELEPQQPAHDAWRRASKAIDEVMTASDRKLTSLEGNSVWAIGGLTLQLATAAAGDVVDGDEELVRAEIVPITRPYRSWRRTIEDVAIPLIARIDDSVRPEARKFVSRIRFNSESPYLGLFVSGVPAEQLGRIDIEYEETIAGQRERVFVRRDVVELVSMNLAGAQRSSMRYLALAAKPPI